jgi:hypothetical protein
MSKEGMEYKIKFQKFKAGSYHKIKKMLLKIND